MGWNDARLLADVLAHAHHRLAAIAGGVLGLVTVLHALQVFGQGLAFGLAPRFNGSGLALRAGLGLQGFELGLQAGLVGSQCFLEQLALLGVHPFGPGGKAPGLQSRQLKRDALDLCVPELDGLRLGGDLLALLTDVPALFTDVLQQLGHHLSHSIGAQTLEVLGFEFTHIEHVCIVQSKLSSRHWDMC